MIRPLTADDRAAYFGLRDRIFRSPDAQFYSDSFEREHALDEEGRREWCTESRAHCILGMFFDDNLVGVAMITRQGEPRSPLVELEACWIDPRFRGGAGRELYESAIEWAKVQGYDYMIGFIRTTFTPAKHLCEHLGFAYSYTIENELWADKTTDDTDAFLMALAGGNAEERQANTRLQIDDILYHAQACIHAPKPQQDALRHLEQTLEVLQEPQPSRAGNGEDATMSFTQRTPALNHRRLG
jgi:GNAT superfamily N-acetyltransferase